MSRSTRQAFIYSLLLCLLPMYVFAEHNVSTETEALASETVDTDTSTSVDDNSGNKSAEEGVALEEDNKDDLDTEKHTATLMVNVTKEGEDDFPIVGATVIVTYEDATEFERKTNASGKAMLTGLPYGKVDVDVISSGLQSGGGPFTLDDPEETLTFQLKPRPLSQQQ